MKKNKLLAGLLALTLVVGMAVPVFATASAPPTETVPPTEGTETVTPEPTTEVAKVPEPAVAPAASSKAEVSTAEELTKALEKADINEITFKNNISVTGGLLINRSITIDGAGKTLTVTGSTSSTYNSAVVIAKETTIKDLTIVSDDSGTKYPLQVYRSTGVVLENVTFEHNKNATGAGLLVNASHVTLKGKTTLKFDSKGAWYGIGLGNGAAPVGSDEAAEITFDTGATVVSELTTKPVIQIDKKDIDKCSVVGFGSLLDEATDTDENKVYGAKPTITFGEVSKAVPIQTLYAQDANGKITDKDIAKKIVAGNHATIKATLTKGIKDYKSVLFTGTAVSNSDKIQLIAVNTSGDYYNAVKAGWGPPENGFPIATAETTYYIVASAAGTYSGTVNLIDKKDRNKIICSADLSITVGAPPPPPQPQPDNRPSYSGGGSSTPTSTPSTDLSTIISNSAVSANTPKGTEVEVPSSIADPTFDTKEVAVNAPEAKEFVNTAANAGFAFAKVFQMNLFDGTTKVTKVSDGRVKIALPFEGKAGYDYIVLRYETNGGITAMPALYKDGQITFTTDHFSLYAIAVASTNKNLFADTTVKPTTPATGATSVPQTGVYGLTKLF